MFLLIYLSETLINTHNVVKPRTFKQINHCNKKKPVVRPNLM